MIDPISLSDAQVKLCGIGTSRCCAYVSMGFVWGCERSTDVGRIIDKRILAGTIGATRQPKLDYPFCQDEPLHD